MIRVRKRERISPINLMPDDTISVSYDDVTGERHELVRETVGRTIVANEVVIFDIDGELGFDVAIGGAIGTAKPADASGFVEGKNYLGEPIRCYDQ